MRPQPRSTMTGSTAKLRAAAATTLTLKVTAHSVGSIETLGPSGPTMAASLMSTSTAPNWSLTRWTARVTWRRSARSAGTTTAVPPRCFTRCAVSASWSSERATNATAMPSAASSTATA